MRIRTAGTSTTRWKAGDSVKRPSFQWYPGDHRRDTAVQACSLEARGLWREMLDLMHDGEPYGHLTAGGVPIDPAQLARIVGATASKLRALLKELDDRNVFSRTDAGVIYSRRMVNDEHKRNVRGAGGAMSLEHPNVPRPKDAGKDGSKDGRKDTFAPSLPPSPAVAVAVASALRTTTTAPTAPAQAERAELWTLIRRCLYVPDGSPPADWDESRDGSILRELSKHHTPIEIAAAIEGLAILRDRPGQGADTVSWLKSGEKITLRALYNSRSGVLQMFAIATQAYWRSVNERPRDVRSEPESIARVLSRATAGNGASAH